MAQRKPYSSAEMIDTSKVTDRRRVRFASLDEAGRDATELVAADAEGRLRATGNWTLGEAVSHVAFWAEAPFSGYPEGITPPWLMRIALRFMKRLMLSGGMPPGIRIRGVAEGTLGAEKTPAGEALQRLRSAFEQIDKRRPGIANPLFGKMTHDEWKQLNLRHAELHFSFFHGE